MRNGAETPPSEWPTWPFSLYPQQKAAVPVAHAKRGPLSSESTPCTPGGVEGRPEPRSSSLVHTLGSKGLPVIAPSPQHCAPPSTSAQLCARPADTAVAPLAIVTFGSRIKRMLLSGQSSRFTASTCPKSSSPQQLTDPSTSNAQRWASPIAISTTGLPSCTR